MDSYYRIQVRGHINVDELNTMSPHQMTLTRMQPAATLFTICTDQSGMIGLLRHLHNLGIKFISITYQPEITSKLTERKQQWTDQFL